MNIAPISEDWPILQEFYNQLAQKLHAQGVKSLTTGGIACVFYAVNQKTKDCDIIIPVEQTATVCGVLAETTFAGQKCHLTLKYGAPLAEKWLNGGWSSHTFFGDFETKPFARVDLFGKPPRVRSLLSDENPIYLSREGVAQMKKTRREKDWGYGNLLGCQMLTRGNPEGLLHLTEIKILTQYIMMTQVSEQLLQERPLLKLALAGSPDLERYLKAEKEFWFRLDDLRLTAYETEWEAYGKALQTHPELLSMDFIAQNQAMTDIAEQTLDPAPLREPKWQNIVEKAKTDTARIFHDLNIDLLPTPIAFFNEKAESPSPNDPEL
jgi:hypothetical protein